MMVRPAGEILVLQKDVTVKKGYKGSMNGVTWVLQEAGRPAGGTLRFSFRGFAFTLKALSLLS